MFHPLTKRTLLVIIILLSFNTQSQEYIFPKNGQSPAQQEQDEYSCHTWAVGETGVDPTQPQQVTNAPVTTSTPPPQGAKPGSGMRGAIGGAAAGALIAEIGDNDASNGAAKGAAIGALSGRRQSRRAAAEQQQAAQLASQQQTEQAQQLTNDQLTNYNKARNVCLDAKGYSISN